MNERILPSGGSGGENADLELLIDSSQSPGGNDAHGLWKLLSDRLAGRWKYAVPLGCLLAVIFSAAGYLSGRVSYESTGIIRVVPNIMPIMRHTAETGLMPLYSSYVQTQAALVTSSRVLERAVQDLNISETPWENQSEAIRAMQSVSARVDRNSELIRVTFSSESPAVSQAVVNAVIRAYDEIYGSAHGEEFSRRLQTLRGIRETLRNQERQQRAQLEQAIANSEYGIGEYGSLINEKAAYIHSAELELRRMNVKLSAQRAALEDDVVDAFELVELVSDEQIDPKRLEAFDEELKRLRRLRENANVEVELARERFSFTRHPTRVAAEDRLRVIERMYDERLQIVQHEMQESGELAALDPTTELELYTAQMREEIEQEREAIARLTRTQQNLNVLRLELADTKQELADANARLRALEVEAEAIRSGRIVIASMGSRPSSPSRDRRKQLAVMGAIGGFGMGVGLFFLLGTIDRRAFAVGQLAGSRTGRVLGVLPALPRSGGDVEAAGIAAHCVHQIRNRLEAVRGSGKSIVLAVTSPEPGDGKTSLAMALAASYATAGARTLLVDGDLCGQGVTRHTQQSGQTGLREALASHTVNGCVREAPLKNLSVLAAGVNEGFGPEMVRRSDLDVLFRELRSKFDVVIVDTGPVFGSIELLPVASAVDGVILTVRRGGRQAHLESCIESLHSVGATYMGLVLNFARASDCQRYASKSKVSGSITLREDGPHGERAQANGHPRERDGVTQNALFRAMKTSGLQNTSNS